MMCSTPKRKYFITIFAITTTDNHNYPVHMHVIITQSHFEFKALKGQYHTREDPLSSHLENWYH